MNNLKLSYRWLLPVLVLALGACSGEDRETSSLESAKSEAVEQMDKMVELSKERWAELKSISAEEWQSTQKSIVELKDKVVDAGSENQARVTELVQEVKALQQEAQAQLKAYGEASGEKAVEAKEALDKNWKKLQSKVDELREELASD